MRGKPPHALILLYHLYWVACRARNGKFGFEDKKTGGMLATSITIPCTLSLLHVARLEFGKKRIGVRNARKDVQR